MSRHWAYWSAAFVAVASAGFLFMVFVVAVSSNSQPDRAAAMTARIQLGARLTVQTAGALVALAAAAGLVTAAFRERQPHNLLTWGMAVLGGILVADPSWAAALAFGLLAAVQGIRHMLADRDRGPPAPGRVSVRPPAGDAAGPDVAPDRGEQDR
jgi:hypothetical protein